MEVHYCIVVNRWYVKTEIRILLQRKWWIGNNKKNYSAGRNWYMLRVSFLAPPRSGRRRQSSRCKGRGEQASQVNHWRPSICVCADAFSHRTTRVNAIVSLGQIHIFRQLAEGEQPCSTFALNKRAANLLALSNIEACRKSAPPCL